MSLALESRQACLLPMGPRCRLQYGLSPGETELFKLKFSDVDWVKGTILIRGTKTGPRQVNLKSDFLERLQARQKEAETEYVIEYNGIPLKQLWRSLKTALEKAGIKKKVRPYDIRHMYGTFMAKNGADIFAIKRLIGRSSITTTERYLHHAEQLQKETVGRLPSLAEGGGKSGLVPKVGPQTRKRRQANQVTL